MKSSNLKRILTALLTAAMIITLCGCEISINTKKAEPTPTPTPTAEPTATPEPTPVPTPVPTTDPKTEAGQIKMIYSNLKSLSSDNDTTKFWYSVTDLDHNGRLELLSAVTEGTGHFTSGRFFEVNENYNGFVEIDLGLKEGEFLPEIIVSSTDCYKSSDGTYSYIYTDTSNGGYGESLSATTALSLRNGHVTIKTIVIDHVTLENGYSVHDFMDGDGKAISYEDFGSMVQNAFNGQTRTTVNFDWFALASVSGPQRLADSYGKFAGKTVSLESGSSVPAAPVATVTPTAVPVVTPVPTIAPTPTPEIIIIRTPVVTKHPTSETLEAGKSCAFIARATDYNYMRWQLIDTYGNVYDAQTQNPYPQMSIWGADGQQLTLGNVPLGMNGWSARAVFTGNGTVYSNAAQIWVKQPKVSTPITAYPGSGSFFYDLYNTVTLYAGTGDKIHYELIRGGDTGPYDSGTITSGQGINVIGIEGQCLTVDLYANVEGDDGNSLRASYTVDRTPVQPTPAPYVPTPAPTSNSCPGIIVDALMSTATIDIYRPETIQVSKDIISPQGSELIGHNCTVYFYGNDPTIRDNIYSVVVDPVILDQ